MLIQNYGSFIISLVTGLLGITVGILVTYKISNRGKRFEGMMFGFTAGLMFSIVAFELLPKSFEYGGLFIGIIGTCIGIITVIFIEKTIDKRLNKNLDYKHMYLRSAILLSIAFSIHNIPEGIAIGSMLAISLNEGIRFAIAITVHNIPEGIIIALPLKKSKVKLRFAVFIAMVISFFMGIGGAIGLLVSYISPIFISISLAFAGGIMLYVTAGEIIVKSLCYWKGRSITIAIILGVLLGIFLSYG